MNWELLHRVNAGVIGLFIVTHLFTHLTAVISPDLHAQYLALFGSVYRVPLFEILLVFLLLMQTLSGLMEFRLRGISAWRRVRNLSGLYLALFLIIHVGSVFFARYSQGIATDFYWVAAGFAVYPLKTVMIGFYGLGVMAFFAHMLAVLALSWPSLPRGLMLVLWAMSLTITGLILAAFSGAFYQVDVPDWLESSYASWFDAPGTGSPF